MNISHTFPFAQYSRIVIVGNVGSGKSYMAKKIAALTGLPLIHLDKEYWQPQWGALPKEEWRQKQEALTAGARWIMDGQYGSTMELRFQAADLVVFLDIHWLVCLISAAKRAGQKRSDLPEYLEEQRWFSREFFDFCRESILPYAQRGRRTVLALHAKYPDTAFLHIKSRREANRLMRT